MEELDKKYSAKETEHKWYHEWNSKKLFKSIPDDRESYTIVIPPPNVTGILHMGHMLNNTIQDLLIRKARMEGKNACWVPGTDHASIATEAKVVGRLREMGIKKSDITREEFLKYAFEWKDKYEAEILGQLKKLGASCDWDRTSFTLSEKYSEDVINGFIALHKKGYLYRDLKIVNWDPEAKTTLSNEEVIYKEVQSKLFFIRYRLDGSDEHIIVATTRPETILGDTAICVNPKDTRYQNLIGKYVIIPLVNRKIKIIADEYVDMEFGTGCLKVTPAHDVNDHALGIKHQLEIIDMMNENGTISEAGGMYIGEDRFVVRKKIIKDFEAAGFLEKIEEIKNNIGYSERTNAVIEPRLSLQWFVDMTKIVTPALTHVMNGDIKFYPNRFVNLYKHWLENIRDWPISRQLYWGQRIPAFYNENNEIAVCKTMDEAIEIFKKNQQSIEGIIQEEDVVDTWFSSWIWPISVFDGFNKPDGEWKYYYPTSVLVTGWDIIFFWVARMIIAGYEFKGEMPFKDVYFTGMVRDKSRKKMSKSLGNSPDAMALIDKYGADGVRFGLLSCSPAGGDLIFDAPFDLKTREVLNESALCEQGRNFCNKLWNALRLIKGWEVYEGRNESNEVIINWFDHQLNAIITSTHHNLGQYRISEALVDMYTFIWDDFCSWYLEFIKPAYQQPIDQYTLDKTIEFFDKMMLLLHPIMPFVTEEIWQHIKARETGAYCMISSYPKAHSFENSVIDEMKQVKALITAIREIRVNAKLKNSERVICYYAASNTNTYTDYKEKIVKSAILSSFEPCVEEPLNAQSIVIKGDTFYIVSGKEINMEDEREKIAAEIIYIQGFIKSVEGKLSNEKFVAGAPKQVVEIEQKKLDDGKARLKALTDNLTQLNK